MRDALSPDMARLAVTRQRPKSAARVDRTMPSWTRARRARAMTVIISVSCAALASVSRAMASVVVVGSVNVDVISRVERPPRREETVLATSHATTRACGGKGANQAVTASRLACDGTSARFVGRFGADELGDGLARELAREVDLTHSARSARGSATGLGFVMLSVDGAPSAVVVGGANMLDWNDDDDALANEFRPALAGATTLLLQREVPTRVNRIAAMVGRDLGLKAIVLDAGGSHEAVDETLLRLVDYVAPNESELAGMARDENGVRPSLKTDEDIIAAARIVTGKLKTKVLCTLGARGAVLIAGPSAEDVTRVEAAPLPPGAEEVDATAAGDAFRAAFAVGLSEGKYESEAMRFAAAAGALTVTKLGAMPSLPSREDVDKLLGVSESRCVKSVEKSSAAAAKEREIAAVRFASRLNSMKSRMDLFPDADENVPEVFNLIKRMGRARGISSVFLNFPEHFRNTKTGDAISALDLRDAVLAQNLTSGAVCVRFPEEPYRLGAFTNPDRAVRKRAELLVRDACRAATSLDADEVVIWPRYDGYDYNLQADYEDAWNDMVQSYKTVTSSDECARLKVSVEFKPTDEKSRFSFIPTTAAAILLADAVGEPNFGLTLDFGHLLAAGENPAHSVSMTASRNLLFGLQLGDGHSRLAAEDGLMFASVHPSAAIDLVGQLRARAYAGVVYFDTFPLNENPLLEAARNVAVFRDILSRVIDADTDGSLARARASRDPFPGLRLTTHPSH